MTARPYWTVWCDGLGLEGERHADGCPQWCESSSAGHTKRESRQAAKRVGWVSRGGLDYSPQCNRALLPADPTKED